MARWNPFGKKDKPADPSQGGTDDAANDSAANDSASKDVAGSDSRGSTNDPTPPAPAGVFGRFKNALKKTVDLLNTDIRDLVGKEGRLVDQDFLDELFALLVKTDMGAGPAGKIRDLIGGNFRGRVVMMDDLLSSAKTVILEIMEQDSADVNMAESGPTVIMVVGVNGAGKRRRLPNCAIALPRKAKQLSWAPATHFGLRLLSNFRYGPIGWVPRS